MNPLTLCLPATFVFLLRLIPGFGLCTPIMTLVLTRGWKTSPTSRKRFGIKAPKTERKKIRDSWAVNMFTSLELQAYISKKEYLLTPQPLIRNSKSTSSDIGVSQRLSCFRPVSAYALFFRDTQAAIKGQNPNASFGEVSKIVASMWDSLDTEAKNVSGEKMM